MHGVIIWSDKAQGRAVIWCEDHGDLAFYRGQSGSLAEISHLEPGDFVYFDLTEDNKLRLALNPRLVAADEYPTLMQDLKDTGREIASAIDMKQKLCNVYPLVSGNPARI